MSEGASSTVVLNTLAIAGASARKGSGFTLRIAEAQDEALVGKEWRSEGVSVIGRLEECDIVVKDNAVSRRHARVERDPDGTVHLRDQKSANGTWMADKRIDDVKLESLDRFRIGGVVFEFLRDDDSLGDDLDAIVTTAIPVREILQNIQAKLAEPQSRLEDEGEIQAIAGNKPFFIDDPEAMWIVETGRLDVFTVAMKDGEPAGARSHFVGVEEGQALFGMDLATYGMGSGFLASGKSGTRLRRLTIEKLQKLAAAGTHAPRIVALVEGWVLALARSLTRDLGATRAADVDLVDGEAVTLSSQKRARAPKSVLWAEVESGALFYVGLSEVAFGEDRVLFPVTREGFVDAQRDDVTFTPVSTSAAVARPDLWAGLAVFHQVLCEGEFLNKKLATADEFNRLKSKAEQAEAAKDAAYQEIGGVLAGAAARERAADIGDVEPLFVACRAVCRALGMEAKKPVGESKDRTFEDMLYQISVASRFRFRQIALRGAWWKKDTGPVLAKFEESKAPVAIIPTGPTTYEWVETGSGKRHPFTPEVASKLEPFGYAFYRRLPDGLLTAKDVVVFGAYGLKADFLWLIGMGLALGALGAMTPYFTGRLFDTAIPQAERSLLLQFCVALLITAFASTAFKLTQSIATLRIEGRMDYSIQASLWDRLLDLPSNFFRNYSAGDLADRANGIDAIRRLLAGAGIDAILGSLSSVFYVFMMFKYSLPLAMTGIGLTIVFVTFMTTANLLRLKLERQQMEIRGKITGLVIQLISGVGKLRVCGAEHHGFRVWASQFAEQKRIGFKGGQLAGAVGVFGSSFPIFANMAVFTVLVGAQAGNPEAKGLTTGDFIAFSAAFGSFLQAMQSLADASLSLLRIVPIWERLRPILETEPEVDESKSTPGTLKGGIEISHVSFRYTPDGPYIVNDLSLKIEPGEFVAFVGGSGCGKSTLMRLMLGFERPEKGTLYFDGMDLSTLDVRLVRQQIGVVLQESRVLPADIYRNIVGSSSRTGDEAWEAAEMSGFADDIRNMPMGMHTYVSEGGGGLSGGQRQRLMIARAVVNKPKILFLDEATSALDNATQAKVTESMNKLRATRIAIAHRLSTIMNADKICYLEAGQIKEMGTYEQLMAKNGAFAALARRQET